MALKNYFYRGYRWQFEESEAPEGAILDEPKPAEPKPAKAPTKRRTTANKRRTTANKSKGA